MWGQLKDLNAKVNLAAVMNAVAPPIQSDDEEDEGGGDGGEYYDTEDEDIDSTDEDADYSGNRRGQPEEEEEEVKQPRRAFGLVGMLSRALDNEQHQDSTPSNEEEEDLFEPDDTVAVGHYGLSNLPSDASLESVPEDSYRNEHTSLLHEQQQQQQQQHDTSSNSSRISNAHHDESMLQPPAAPPKQDERGVSPSRDPSTSRRALVRETGSVTPTKTSARKPQAAVAVAVTNNGRHPSLEQLPSSPRDNGKEKSAATPPVKVSSRSHSDMAALASLSATPRTFTTNPKQGRAPTATSTLVDSTADFATTATDNAAALTSSQSRPTKAVSRGIPAPTGPVAAAAETRVPKQNVSKPLTASRARPTLPVPVETEQKSSTAAAFQEEENKVESPPPERAVQPTVPKQATPAAAAAQNGDPKASKQLDQRCQELQRQLGQAESHIVELQQQQANQMEQDEEARQRQVQSFQEKEARLLEGAAEDHQQELRILRQEMDSRFSAIQQDMAEERGVFQKEQDQMERLLEEATSRAELAERQAQQALTRTENDTAQHQQRQERSLRMAEDKLAQSMAVLDDREDQLKTLKATLKSMKGKMSEHREGAQEAEEEMDELHTENETLRHHAQTIEAECVVLREKVADLEGESDKVSSLKLELRMLREDYQREKSKNTSVAASAESSTVQLEGERNAAMAEAEDLRQQLAASLADVEVARSDTNRVMTGNNNLQGALEALQGEREAELSMLEEQRMEADEATAAAHAATLAATHEANTAHIREIQQASDEALKKTMEEQKQLEAKLETFRAENVQMRRSLDEAIHRLQTTQEDVIDRTLMKNILLDWLMKTNAKEKKPILEVMASVLHFTEEEKQKVHIDDRHIALGKVMGPFPPSKADMQHLEGDNVREKWVNFLLAETDDD